MKKNSLLSLMFSLVICMCMMPMITIESLAASTAAVSYTYYTVDEADETKAVKHTDGSCENYTTVTSSTTSFDNGKWYVASENVYIGSRITVYGEANLILCDGVKLDTEYGITVNAGNTLNIYAQSEGTGKFSSGKGIQFGACIGGLNGQSCGTVNIHGGIIEAVSDRFGSGIGTGDGGIGGNINIFDGKITAESDGGYRAGIGGGTGGRVDGITIYGGTVDAKQLSTAGAAIGGGNGCDSGDITINGGTVTAYSCGAGIGCGDNGKGGNVTINGGTVTATGSNSGDGIGGGKDAFCDSITINGGTVDANSINNTSGFGLGGGNITINGGTVTASGYQGVHASEGGTLELGENVTFKAGDNKDSITVSGDKDNAYDALGKRYFEATDVLAPVEYAYYTVDGNKAVKHEDGSCEDYIRVKDTTSFEDGKWYVVKKNVKFDERLSVGGTVNLILCDGATLTASKGIEVSEGNTLNIYGQAEGTGTLAAQTGDVPGVAAIGGNAEKDGGTISIHGGNINASSLSWGAGIGGGTGCNGGSITIFDGVINAKGGEYSAAIGGGRSGDGGTVIIYGGTVNAATDGNACGIGGGNQGYSGNITINGGTVNASSGDVAIGGTHDQNGSVTINGGTVTAIGDYRAINNCVFALGEAVSFEAGTSKDNITATGDMDNASDALKCEYVRATGVLDPVEYVYYTVDGNKAVKHEDGSCEDYIKVKDTTTSFKGGKWYVVSKDVTIDNHITVEGTANIILCDGKTLTAASGTGVAEGSTLNIYAQREGTGAYVSESGANNASGIGGYDEDGKHNCGTVNIHGGVVTAKGGSYGAGIGGGPNGAAGNITINGGTVNASGNQGGAGIGGGYNGEGGNITIYGGKVNANAGNNAAAIGGGQEKPGGVITINGGTVNASGAVGIGGGQSGDGGTITINGGEITACGVQSSGIGGGQYGAAGNITINGGTVNASGNQGGAGIGGGAGGDGGTIIINGGIVIATGGFNSKAIGAGLNGPQGTLTLGDEITFAAGADKDNITVTGDELKVDKAFGNKYFESPSQHTHTFDQEVVSDDYLKSAANCTEAATYRKSCKCGEASEADTFTVGEPVGHKYGEASYKWSDDECTAERSCTVCEEGTGGHSQTETVAGTYVKDTDADCTNAETGHYVAEFANEAFETQRTAEGSVSRGNALGHEFPDTWEKYDAVQHKHTCIRCKTEVEYADHIWDDGDVTKAATLTEDGVKTCTCTVCSEAKDIPIYAAKTVKLSRTAYTYNGKKKNPKVTVNDSKGNAIPASNYTVVTPSGRTKVGKYTYTVKFTGDYDGSKSLSMKVDPPKTSIKSLSKGRKSFKVKWARKSTQVTGYQIQYSTKSSFSKKKTVTVKSRKTASKTVKKLKAKKKYYVRVRTYKTVKGTKYYSAWSSKKAVKTR